MLEKVKCKIDERVTTTSFLKVKSISVFDDAVILDTLNNPKYPIGDENDNTRLPSFYNSTFEYLKSLGLHEI
jgi:hypothetical protein